MLFLFKGDDLKFSISHSLVDEKLAKNNMSESKIFFSQQNLDKHSINYQRILTIETVEYFTNLFICLAFLAFYFWFTKDYSFQFEYNCKTYLSSYIASNFNLFCFSNGATYNIMMHICTLAAVSSSIFIQVWFICHRFATLGGTSINSQKRRIKTYLDRVSSKINPMHRSEYENCLIQVMIERKKQLKETRQRNLEEISKISHSSELGDSTLKSSEVS